MTGSPEMALVARDGQEVRLTRHGAIEVGSNGEASSRASDALAPRHPIVLLDDDRFLVSSRGRWRVVDSESKAVVQCCAVSPDGVEVAFLESGRAAEDHGARLVRVMNLSSPDAGVRLEVRDGTPSVLAFSPDAHYLVAGTDNGSVGITVWRTGSWQEEAAVGTSCTVSDMAFSRDGKFVALAGGKLLRPNSDVLGPLLELYSVPDFSLVSRLVTREDYTIQFQRVNAVAFSPDGRDLVSGTGAGNLQLWDVQSGRRRREIGAFGEPLWDVAFSSDGNVMKSVGRDGTVKTWNHGATWVEIVRGHKDKAWDLAVASDGRTFFTGSDHSYIKWSLELSSEGVTVGKVGSFQLPIDGSVHYGLVSADNERLALGHRVDSIEIYQLMSEGANGIVGSREAELRAATDAELSTLVFNPDATRLIASYTDDTMQVFDREEDGGSVSWSETRRFTAETHARPFEISPDGELFAMTRRGWNELHIGKVATLETETRVVTFGEIRTIRFSPDARLVACSTSDGMVHIWNLQTRELDRSFEAHEFRTGGLAFHPSATRLATGADNGVVKIWDLAVVAGEAVSFEVLTLDQHDGPVTGLAFTPDGRTLLSVGGKAGEFGEVGVWSGGSRELTPEGSSALSGIQ
jgi:WD40 repeat protein